MQIPVFISRPSWLRADQDACYRVVLGELGHVGCAERTLGQTDYSTSFPLREVLTLAKHCSGGVILGFSQFEATGGTWKRGHPDAKAIAKGKAVPFPTPWNQLEAGILFALNLPLLVFREKGIAGGVFDHGVTDRFIHEMPSGKPDKAERKAIREVFQKWAAQVSAHYYGER